MVLVGFSVGRHEELKSPCCLKTRRYTDSLPYRGERGPAIEDKRRTVKRHSMGGAHRRALGRHARTLDAGRSPRAAACRCVAISAELAVRGFVNENGRPFAATSVKLMLD
jgi:hypothetical protein